jgi:crotonobetainyl-CoA:carnitine CoA-transferase CaiB-like acyl-CoA transferase
MTDPKQGGPLAGYRVLELGSTIAGPFCGRLLADFGAEVVKVEMPTGDPLRAIGESYNGKGLYATSLMRNKWAMVVDLRQPDGQQLIRTMVDRFDVLIENFRPGTMEKWGLDYEALSTINPGLVMVRISGFGQTGPYSNRPGYGIIGEAFSGLMYVTGHPDKPPARSAISLTDCITGLYGAFGALMALLSRQETGKGQMIDAALYECAFSFMDRYVPTHDKLGIVPTRAGARLGGHSPNNLFPTGDEQFIHIAAAGATVFVRLATVMGREDLLSDSRFNTPQGRNKNWQLLDEIVTQWCAQHPLDALEKMLHEADVPATRVATMADVFKDAHYRAREMLITVHDDDLGPLTHPGVVPKLSETPGHVHWSGRRLGQDTRHVLTEIVGLPMAEVDRLEAAGVVHCEHPESQAGTEPTG